MILITTNQGDPDDEYQPPTATEDAALHRWAIAEHKDDLTRAGAKILAYMTVLRFAEKLDGVPAALLAEVTRLRDAAGDEHHEASAWLTAAGIDIDAEDGEERYA